jgi:hypothetical protein
VYGKPEHIAGSGFLQETGMCRKILKKIAKPYLSDMIGRLEQEVELKKYLAKE